MVSTDPTKFEDQFPGCSQDELPWWPSSIPVYYRVVPMKDGRHGVGRIIGGHPFPNADTPLYGPNDGGHQPTMLIASRGMRSKHEATLACWSCVAQTWVMVCP